MNVIAERYPNITNMMKTIQERPNAATMTGKSSSQRIGAADTRDWQEALGMLMNGTWDKSNLLIKKVAKIERLQTERYKRTNEVYLSPVGYAPHVPNSIIGVPNNMYNQKKTKLRLNKILNITYVLGAPGYVENEALQARGCVVLGAIMALEKKGYRVNLDIAKVSMSDNFEPDTIMAYTVRIKRDRETINLKKVAFPMAHPAMHRRMSYKWLETNPQTTRAFNSGYGYSINTAGEKTQAAIGKELRRQINADIFIALGNITWVDSMYNVTLENIDKMAELILKGGHMKSEKKEVK